MAFRSNFAFCNLISRALVFIILTRSPPLVAAFLLTSSTKLVQPSSICF